MTHFRHRKFNTKDTYPEQKLDNDLAQAVVARGRTVFLRGQCPQDLDTAKDIGSHDPVEQTHKVMQNIRQLIEECGGKMEHLCKVVGPSEHAGTMASGLEARCVAVEEGSLRARIDGDLRADIDWAPPLPQCRGGPRPGGDGVRLIYRGELPGQGRLLVVIGIGPLAAGQDARQVPANVTLVREGTGLFYATQGDDKCAVDSLRQTLIGDDLYRLTVRGYCVQPARTLDGARSVLMSRFDATAVATFR